MGKILNDDGFFRLCVAIIEQAVKEYKKALLKDDTGEITALERFFLSEYGEAISHNNGAKIIRLARREVEEEREQNDNTYI